MNPLEVKNPVVLQPPTTTNGGFSSTYMPVKNFQEIVIFCIFTQAVGHATTASVYEATNSSGGSAQAITKTLPVWLNTDISLTSVLTRQTDAKLATLAATAKNQIAMFKIDPSLMDLEDSMDHIGIVVSDSSQATNFCTILAIGTPRYTGHDQVSHV
jgi:hypothetical protein